MTLFRSRRSVDGGIDEIPLPGVPGRLWLCGKHAIAPDPEAALSTVGRPATVVCLTEAHELGDRYPEDVAWLRSEAGSRAVWFPIHDLHAPPPDEALATVAAHRPMAGPEAGAQRDLVDAFAALIPER